MDATEYRLRQEKLDEMKIDMLKEQELRNNFDEIAQYVLDKYDAEVTAMDITLDNIQKEFENYGWRLSKEEIIKELDII